MRYYANPCGEAAEDAMRAGHLGLIDTPYQGKTRTTSELRAAGVEWCADNGAFASRWDEATWWTWLRRHTDYSSTCAFAVAPDVVGDAWRSHITALPWLDRIRALGYPVAYVAQNGIDRHPMMPWDDFDVLFIGGCRECPVHGPIPEPIKVGHGTGAAARYACTECRAFIPEWKLGPVPRALAAEARARGKDVHMGRVNSRKRYEYARAIGCTSVDGTFLTRGPRRRLPELLDWVAGAERAHPTLY